MKQFKNSQTNLISLKNFLNKVIFLHHNFNNNNKIMASNNNILNTIDFSEDNKLK